VKETDDLDVIPGVVKQFREDQFEEKASITITDHIWRMEDVTERRL